MTTEMLDPRVAAWLDAGPDAAPPISFETIMAGIAVTAQEPRHARFAGRVLPTTRSRLLLAAAGIVVAVGTGAYLLRDGMPDVATPPAPTSLLARFPNTSVIEERSGGPAAEDGEVVIVRLPREHAYVVVASCTGGGEMTADLWDRSVEFGPDVPESEKLPNDRLDVPCDGTLASMRVATVDLLTDDNEITLGVRAGTSWRVAVGEVLDLPAEPEFAPYDTGEGALTLISMGEPMLSHAENAGGIGVQVPPGVSVVTALVQCSGAPLEIRRGDGSAVGTAPCDDPAVTHRFDLEVTDPSAGYLDVHVGVDGFTWYRLAAEAIPGEIAARPEAPPLPDGLADVRFADGDDSNVAFGSLGSNVQVVKAIGGRPVGSGIGDVVPIRRPDGAGEVLELWRMSDATAIGPLATVTDGQFFTAWIDAPNEQVFYGLSRYVDGVPTGEWHRVALDGTGDVEIAVASPISEVTFAQERLAADGTVFVAQWCLPDRCERTIYDTASGEMQRIDLPADPPCWLVGVAAGRIVTATPGCDGTGGEATVAEDLDSGKRTTIRDARAYGEVVITSQGPAIVFTDSPDENHTTVSVMGLDGSNARELWTSEHEPGFDPRLSSVVPPIGDWVLLAGPVGDTPMLASIGRPVPVLLNVVTGERIELPNLPFSE